jgi:hypothetical protein
VEWLCGIRRTRSSSCRDGTQGAENRWPMAPPGRWPIKRKKPVLQLSIRARAYRELACPRKVIVVSIGMLANGELSGARQFVLMIGIMTETRPRPGPQLGVSSTSRVFDTRWSRRLGGHARDQKLFGRLGTSVGKTSFHVGLDRFVVVLVWFASTFSERVVSSKSAI